MRWLLVLACACNQVLGVQKTRLSDALSDDIDGDGVPNAKDNCPTVANPQQEDRDHDGIGDACDLCRDVPSATNHDEDGDRVGDVCDDCPMTADFQGMDADQDGIGDACDPIGLLYATRVRFDSFETLGPPWRASGVPWHSDGDEVAPMALLPIDDNGLVAPQIVLPANSWSIELEIVSHQPWSSGDVIGLVMLDATTNQEVAECAIRCTAGCYLTMQVPNTAPTMPPITPSPIVHLWMRWYPSTDMSGVECYTEEVYGGSVVTAGGPASWTPSLRATPTAAIGAVDILQ